jgi:hypothetical protein
MIATEVTGKELTVGVILVKVRGYILLGLLVGCADRPLYVPEGSGDLAGPSRPDLAVPAGIDLSVVPVPDLAAPPVVDLAAPPPCGRPPGPPADAPGRVAWGVTASWTGVVHTPWTSDYNVSFTFRADGTYVASAPNGELPLYYDSDPETGKWKLQNLLTDGEATGWLTLQWSDFQEPWSEVTLNAAWTHLHFTYYHLGMYGPITYELDCRN